VRELLRAERSLTESVRARRGEYVAPRSLQMGSCAWRYNVARRVLDRHDPRLLHSRYMSRYIFARSLLLGLLVGTHQLSGAEHVALHRGLQVGLGRA